MTTLKSVLIVVDGTDWKSDVAFVYARELKDILTHYRRLATVVREYDYKENEYLKYDAVMYLGVHYGTSISPEFREDVLAMDRPLYWIGYNMWKVAWDSHGSHDQSFEARFGLRFVSMREGFSRIEADSEDYIKQTPEVSELQIMDQRGVKVMARAINNSGTSVPYITRSGNLFIVGDNPLAMVDYSVLTGHDRIVIFLESLHEFFATNAPTAHFGLLRIADVSPESSPRELRLLADLLKKENVPFVVSVIPFYRDPLGYWKHSGKQKQGYERTLANSPEVVSALKYMVSKGGQIICHGMSHQYENVKNYHSGVTGDDWEFYRLSAKPGGSYSVAGPVEKDSPLWVNQRIATAKAMFKQVGLDITGWLTPHYLASSVDYRAFGEQFSYSLDPSVYFADDQQSKEPFVRLFAPFPVHDSYGRTVLPESAGYVSFQIPNSKPADLIVRARKLLKLRDSWFAMYFHYFLEPKYLLQIIREAKRSGYKFVSPSALYDPLLSP